MHHLLTQLVTAIDRRQPCVWSLVAATRGSTPQKAGAAMLAFPDGSQAGTLGGGCVEAEVKRRALHLLAAGGGPEAFTFTLDDDYGWDDGLICGGRMTILAHPISADSPDFASASEYYRRLLTLEGSGTGWTEAIVIEGVAGDRYLFDSAGDRIISLARTPAWKSVAANLAPLSDRPKPAVRAGVAYLPHAPRVTVLLVGGGHVGQAVATLAAQVGFGVWILDDREKYAGADRFPEAERRIVGNIGDTLRDLVPTLGPNTFALILTRGHSHDEEALLHLAGSACGYIGMIGSKRKIRLIFDDLIEKGISRESLDTVHAPLGFDIGSQTVPEIAVSIVAELIAVRNLGKGPKP
jgi:xanthine dehydrogenase accessory factor